MPTTSKFPVAEIFGPTIQGEGEHQGAPAYFVRFGGCDFRCEWCDTPHAVLPEAVRHLPRRTSEEIRDALVSLPLGPSWVVLTGGNPALLQLSSLLDLLHEAQYLVSIETQGTKWRDWIHECDSICISPKPPSSGMARNKVEPPLARFMSELSKGNSSYFFKVVVFDQADYEWAEKIHREYFWVPMFLSAGNDAGRTVGRPDRIDKRSNTQVAQDLIHKTRWLANRTMMDGNMRDVRVQAQTHVLLWGNERGH